MSQWTILICYSGGRFKKCSSLAKESAQNKVNLSHFESFQFGCYTKVFNCGMLVSRCWPWLYTDGTKKGSGQFLSIFSFCELYDNLNKIFFLDYNDGDAKNKFKKRDRCQVLIRWFYESFFRFLTRIVFVGGLWKHSAVNPKSHAGFFRKSTNIQSFEQIYTRFSKYSWCIRHCFISRN